MESIKSHYIVEKVPDYSGKYRKGCKLIIDKDLADYWGEIPVCQKCSRVIRLPAFFCYEKDKLFCKECERALIGVDTCGLQFIQDEHEHLRIIQIALK